MGRNSVSGPSPERVRVCFPEEEIIPWSSIDRVHAASAEDDKYLKKLKEELDEFS